MEHVKKMVVVPQELIDRLNSNNVMTQPRQQSSAGGLDTEMHRILNDKHLDDVEKWKQYQQVLRRFLHLTSQQRGPVHMPLVDTGEVEGNETDVPAAGPLPQEDELVETFSATYRPGARNLLRWITRRVSDRIKWAPNYTVQVDGQSIPGSNIVDILHDTVRARKPSGTTPGWLEVMSVLKEENAPVGYMGNQEARKYLSRLEADLFSSAGPRRSRSRSPANSPPSPHLTRSSRPYKQQTPSGKLPVQRWEHFSL